MREEDLKRRLRDFAIRILNLIDSLPNTVSGRTIANQLARSGTSVAANYRVACRGRSRADFIAKLGIVEEEADESEFWLDMIIARKLLNTSRVEPLRQEAGEIVAIMVASRKSAARRGFPPIKNQNSKIKNADPLRK